MTFGGLNIALFTALLTVPAAIVYVAVGLPYPALAITAGVVALAFLAARNAIANRFIDVVLSDAVGGDLESYSEFSRAFPDYRFVDLHRAATAIAKERDAKAIASEHKEPLALLLTRQFYGGDARRKQNKPQQASKPIAHGKEAFFAIDNFWVLKRSSEAITSTAILRVRTDPYAPRVLIEVGATSEAEAMKLMDEIADRAKAESIYRERVLELVFSQVRDDQGELATGSLELIFRAPVVISGDELILPAATRAVIERNIVAFHELRPSLQAVGVPAKKGVLFYGPPGTGKTFTCKYLAHRLGVTTLIVAGQSLLHVKSICNLARMLQPALVILEDVDLVYSDRDTNPFSTSLGDLMDELDGFGTVDQLTFVLTTNDIDRVERAIKDRPGRVSQCIEFDNPSAPLREAYLRRLLGPYQHERVSLDVFVKNTEGASQAFLKELVYRAVQLSLERTAARPTKPGEVELVDSDVGGALEELTSGSGIAGRSIVGFGKR